jgi:DNA-binding NarL/FixJ family response regulator
VKPIRVLIADDHAVVRKGIQMIVNTEPAIEMIGEAEDGQSAFRQVESLQPDVVLMDLVMPGEDGIKVITQIKHMWPDIKVIVLTTFGDEGRINAALEAGADGYLLKDADGEALLRAIKTVQQGDMPLHPRVARHFVNAATQQVDTNGFDCLTEREKEVLRLVAKGLSNKAISQALDLKEGTVKIYVSNILAKLNVATRTEAAVWAIQMGLVSPDATA